MRFQDQVSGNANPKSKKKWPVLLKQLFIDAELNGAHDHVQLCTSGRGSLSRNSTLGAAYVQDSNTVHCLIKFERSEISRDIVVAEIVRACLLLEIGADHKRRANQDKDGRRANKTRLRKEGLLNN